VTNSGHAIEIGPYDDILETRPDGRLIERSLSRDDESFATRIAGALRVLLGRRPAPVSAISNTLQGNLCEFCVWELGEQHWQLYDRNLTWPANAKSPWRSSSRGGVDVLALGSDLRTLLIIEVKSTQGDGCSPISGESSSLKNDFRRLYEAGSPDERIWGSVQEAVTSLKLAGEVESAARIVDSVGSRPDECTGIRLIGVLVCRKGDTDKLHRDRRLAFETLHEWLLEAGWRSEQCEFRCVELVDFVRWLSSLVREVTR
jgi:hypothetical protein